MLKSHIAGQPHRIRPSSPRASISLRTAAQRRSRSLSEGVGYSTSLRIALRPPAFACRGRAYDIGSRAAMAAGAPRRLTIRQHKVRSSPRKRGSSVTDCGPWIPAISAFTRVFDALCAGMNGSEALRRALFRRALAQDVPELRLKRGERFHQLSGIELPGDAGRQLVCGVIGKMSPVCLPIQHRAAPSQLAMQDRSAAVKVGLRMIGRARSGLACCDWATQSVFPLPAIARRRRAWSRLWSERGSYARAETG